jgi:hypothetical protein
MASHHLHIYGQCWWSGVLQTQSQSQSLVCSNTSLQLNCNGMLIKRGWYFNKITQGFSNSASPSRWFRQHVLTSWPLRTLRSQKLRFMRGKFASFWWICSSHWCNGMFLQLFRLLLLEQCVPKIVFIPTAATVFEQWPQFPVLKQRVPRIIVDHTVCLVPKENTTASHIDRRTWMVSFGHAGTWRTRV